MDGTLYNIVTHRQHLTDDATKLYTLLQSPWLQSLSYDTMRVVLKLGQPSWTGITYDIHTHTQNVSSLSHVMGIDNTDTLTTLHLSRHGFLAMGFKNDITVVHNIYTRSHGMVLAPEIAYDTCETNQIPEVTFVRWSPNGMFLAICYNDGRVSIWKLVHNSISTSMRCCDRFVVDSIDDLMLVWSPDSKYIAYGCGNTGVILHEVVSTVHKTIEVYPCDAVDSNGLNIELLSMAWTLTKTGQTLLACAFSTYEIKVWNTNTDLDRWTLIHTTQNINGIVHMGTYNKLFLEWDACGRYLYVQNPTPKSSVILDSHNQFRAVILDINEPEPVRPLTQSATNYVDIITNNFLAWSPTKQLVAREFDDGTYRIGAYHTTSLSSTLEKYPDFRDRHFRQNRQYNNEYSFSDVDLKHNAALQLNMWQMKSSLTLTRCGIWWSQCGNYIVVWELCKNSVRIYESK